MIEIEMSEMYSLGGSVGQDKNEKNRKDIVSNVMKA